MSDSDPAASEPSFEAILARLHEVVSELERGDLPLERSLALFEEGVRLAREGSIRLDRAEARVAELLAATEGGAARIRPFEPRNEGTPTSGGPGTPLTREPQ
jgi:exodeoxyribonuclease VII small subunit